MIIILYIFGFYACVCAGMFLIVCQPAEPIGTKLGTRIHFDPGIVLGKSRSRSEHRRCENGGALGEAPRGTEAGECRWDETGGAYPSLWRFYSIVIIIIIRLAVWISGNALHASINVVALRQTRSVQGW